MNNSAEKLSASDIARGLTLWERLNSDATLLPSVPAWSLTADQQLRLQLAPQFHESLNDIYWDMQTAQSQRMDTIGLTKRFWTALTGRREHSSMDKAMAVLGLRYEQALLESASVAEQTPPSTVLSKKINVRKPIKLVMP